MAELPAKGKSQRPTYTRGTLYNVHGTQVAREMGVGEKERGLAARGRREGRRFVAGQV